MTARSGIVVIELASDATAYAGKLLGDMGADVILVEPPSGSAMRSTPPFDGDEPGAERSLYWWHYQTSKRSIRIDLDQTEGVDLLRRLVGRADVLLEAERPGRVASLGLDDAVVRGDNAGLVHAAITGFGRESDRADEPVTDLTILAGGGPVWSCGYSDHSIAPIRGGGYQGFHIGAHYAVMAILTTLIERETSGLGQFIDVSQHAAANITTEMASYHWLIQQTTVQRQTGRHASERESMPTQVRCADGRYVNTGVLPRRPHEFRGLVAWMRDLGLADELPEMVFLEMGAARERLELGDIGRDDETTAIFAAAREAMAFIATRVSAVDYFLGAQRAGIPVGVVYSPEEAFEDEHFVARGFPTEVDHGGGRRVRYPGAPYRFEKTPWSIQCRAPHLGEHDGEIRAWLDGHDGPVST